MDLFQLAKEVGELLRRFEEAKARAKDGGSLLDIFARRVEEAACVPINMRPSVLTELIHDRKHQNIYEWAAEQSRLSSRPVEEVLMDKLGEYFIRRIHFDDAFQNGRRFRYGTLNIGGLGASRYGQFCTVLRSDFIDPEDQLAYLMSDSLRDYMLTETEVDVRRLEHESATHSHVAKLAAVKHGRELAGRPESEWPGMVCDDDGYIEAIFVKDVGLSAVVEVRVSQTEYDRLFDFAFTDYTQAHDDATHALKSDFVNILRASSEYRFTLKRM